MLQVMNLNVSLSMYSRNAVDNAFTDYNVTLNYSLKRSLHVCVLILTVILDTQRVREACSASSYKLKLTFTKEKNTR